MADKFNFHIIKGATKEACQLTYDGITHTNDNFTFYLFENGGIGYLGETPLFGNFQIISSNATLNKQNRLYFVTANCTLTDNQATPVSTNAKKGSIWTLKNNGEIEELSYSVFQEYMARYITANAIKASNITGNTYTGDDNHIMTSAAVKALVDAVVTAETVLNIQFFRDVELHTITQPEKNSGQITCFTDKTLNITANDHAGDVGLVFMCQVGDTYDESESDNDRCIFINLHDLLVDYVAGTSNTTTVTVADKQNTPHTKEIKVEVNKASADTDNQIATFKDIVLNAIDTVYEHEQDNTNLNYDPSDDNLSNNKFVTEAQLANILANVLVNFVQETETISAGGESMSDQ